MSWYSTELLHLGKSVLVSILILYVTKRGASLKCQTKATSGVAIAIKAPFVQAEMRSREGLYLKSGGGGCQRGRGAKSFQNAWFDGIISIYSPVDWSRMNTGKWTNTKNCN